MQIRRIQIADFGKLHDMELDFSEGFQTITGENGWGKSTGYITFYSRLV